MGHIHLYILIYNLIKCRFRHLLDSFQIIMKVFCQTKQRVTLWYSLRTYLTCKIVKSSKEIGVNLLQGFHFTNVFVCHKVAFPKSISLFATLPVDGIVAIGEPVEEVHSALIICIFCKQFDSFCIQYVCIISLTISSTQFQLVSTTNQLISFLTQFSLKIFPVVTVLLIVWLVVDSSNNILHREPPLGIFFIPNGSDLMILIKAKRYLAHLFAKIINIFEISK